MYKCLKEIFVENQNHCTHQKYLQKWKMMWMQEVQSRDQHEFDWFKNNQLYDERVDRGHLNQCYPFQYHCQQIPVPL